jgi:hypothetical protein
MVVVRNNFECAYLYVSYKSFSYWVYYIKWIEWENKNEI